MSLLSNLHIDKGLTRWRSSGVLRKYFLLSLFLLFVWSPLTSAKGIRSLVPVDQDVPLSPRQVQCYPGLGHEYAQSRAREWLPTLQ